MVTSSNTLIAQPAEIITSGNIVLPGSQTRRFPIPGDVVRQATADMDESARAPIWWLYNYCVAKDFDRDELGRLLKKSTGKFYSADSVLQLLRGDRARKGEPITQILDAIRPLRELEMQREMLKSSGFIRTRHYNEFERRCDRARMRQRILFTFGDSQIGKTTWQLHYQRTHNHGQTIYVDTPTGGALGPFVKALGSQFNIPATGRMDYIQERIFSSFDSTMLLLVDNAHRCLSSRTPSSGLATFSFIQQIFDRCHTGMQLAMTNEGRKQLLFGDHAKQLEQVWRRRINPYQLPNVTPSDDLALFAAAYGLPPANDEPLTVTVSYQDEHGRTKTASHTDTPLSLQTKINEDEGLGVWITILQDASDMADEQKRKITWGAVIKAACKAQADAEIYI